ncbi:MAG: hypothetical protein ACXWJ9_17705 [Caldimonas sp.]
MNILSTLTSPTSALRGALALGLAGACVCAAHADCGAVITAYAKADATKRFAVLDVDSINAAPKGDTIIAVIGDVQYTQNIVRKGPLNIVLDGYKAGPYYPGIESGSLKDREGKGSARCEPLGERKIGTETAVGYRVRNNDRGTQPDPTATDVWVSRATGLPVWHGMGSDGGGFRWVYGAAVIAPDPATIKK